MHGPRKKPLHFDDNPDHVTLGLGLWYEWLWLRLGDREAQLHSRIITAHGMMGLKGCVSWHY